MGQDKINRRVELLQAFFAGCALTLLVGVIIAQVAV